MSHPSLAGTVRLICLVLIAQFTCTTAQADPAIWCVQGKRNTLYLLGTIHLLPSDEQLADNIQRAYAESEQLLMEMDMDDLDVTTIQTSMMQTGLLPANQNLSSQLDTTTRRNLQSAIKAMGIESERLAHFQPWLAALTLEQLHYASQGFNADSGIESQLTRMAKHDHKPIQGLETVQQQINLFAGMERSAQLDLLRQMLEELNESPDELQSLLQAWRRGDTDQLQTYLQQGFDENPQLLGVLTTRRNNQWLSTLVALLDQESDDYLVAVGALHLLGDQGLVSLLQQAGYSVTRQ